MKTNPLKKVVQYIYLCAFFLLLTPFLWGHYFRYFEDTSLLKVDNPLTFSVNPTDSQKLDMLYDLGEYIDSHFPLQKTYKIFYNHLMFVEFREDYLSEIIFGKDDWLFYNSTQSLDSFQNVDVEQDTIQETMNRLLIINEFAADNGLELIFVIAPNKSTIYPEYFLELELVTEKRFANELIQLNQENGEPFPIIYPADALLAAKGNGDDLLYFKTDTHWTRGGALLALDQVLQEINNPDQLALWKGLHFTTEEKVGGDISKRLVGLEMFGYEWNAPGEEIAVVQFNAMEIEVKGQCQGYSQYELLDSDLPGVVVYFDSFGNALKNVIPEIFSSVVHISGNQCGPFKVIKNIETITVEQPIEYMIVILVERNLASPETFIYRLSDALRKGK